MPAHLVYNEWAGAQEQSGALPDSGMVPVAFDGTGRIVYARSKPRRLKAGLTAYDDAVIKKLRRELAETVLGYLALKQGATIVEATLDRVSSGMLEYWRRRGTQLQSQAHSIMVDASDKYLYGATSFGRLTRPRVAGWVPKLDQWLRALSATPRDIPKIMNVHDNFLRIFRAMGPSDLPEEVEQRSWLRPLQAVHDQLLDRVLRPRTRILAPEARTAEKAEEAKLATKRKELQGRVMGEAWRWNLSPQWRTMERVATQVRPSSLFDPSLRGRKDLGAVAATDAPGLIKGDMARIHADDCLARLGLTMAAMRTEELRVRGVDKFTPELDTMAPEFKQALETHHLLFGAGPSGTTGTLLASACTFGNLDRDALIQYLFACVGYLVGSGMHTCHEVFLTGSLLGLPYETGKYHRSLPPAFRTTKIYDSWQIEFNDVAPR
jgi:hypothetical protein